MTWKKLKQEPIFDSGYRKLIRKTFQLPNGKLHDFDIKDEPPVVCVVGLTKEDKVLLVKEFRPGMEKELLEIPGGIVDKNEKPLDAAKREFLEETARCLDMNLKSNGEKGAYEHYVDEKGNVIVMIDPKYFRPTEVDLLLADATKAKTKLGWEPETKFNQLIKIMCNHDLALAQKERYVKDVRGEHHYE